MQNTKEFEPFQEIAFQKMYVQKVLGCENKGCHLKLVCRQLN